MNSVYGSMMVWTVFIVWLIPFVLVLKSNKSTGGESSLGYLPCSLFLGLLGLSICLLHLSNLKLMFSKL